MDRETLKKLVKENNLNLGCPIYFDNEFGDGYCVRKNYRLGWEVFCRERGNEYDFVDFRTESEALDYLYDVLLRTERLINPFFDRAPDVEVIFEFNGTRMNPTVNGYRPHHLVTNDYLTTGVHHYYDVDSVPPNGTAKGTITFLQPEAYPHSLWIGKRINIQEGSRIVGYAIVSKILNPILQN